MFSDRLKQLRKVKKVSQKQLADSINIAERHYQKLEYGETTPGIDIAIAIADYFDVSLDYLVGRSDDPMRH